ncbi:unnamed protein product [Triticum turgidum subsp. durum]|uniref:DNA helicase n=1 Tax=Triticum turgidum subsp. durum TaxID=4567 RepID=A0A9R0SC34_TRITD|nr:unnamed protein product [Triticum turgidum subsp. durum]
MDPAQAEAYLHMIREQQRLGLRQLRRHAAEPEYERDVGSNGEDEEEGGGRRKGMAARSSLGHRVDPRELEPGEYVVHKKVGVGKFVCISGEDGEDYVFIHPHEKKRPRNLSKLNDPSTWEKRRLKGKLAVQKMVVNLMELYLQRMRQRRPPYRKPEAMDQFASEFPYEPTPDQNQAFIDIENDLTERETPMDRLICGDVGFGKTEVAMRAIFIVVSTGYQAMVLAPTVILANQHYDVMSERFSNYPDIKVAIFSGAQSKDEKDELITKITNGHLQIIVGTHALLTERMAYNNLGLLVVDEEQKFGVQQKEKIASFKASIDVLTLSATPIPRTLYLALTGFRDASLMSTPPPERVAVKTYVSAFSRESALSAIKLELKRGGQVFYVVPRIKVISSRWIRSQPNTKLIPVGNQCKSENDTTRLSHKQLLYMNRTIVHDLFRPYCSRKIEVVDVELLVDGRKQGYLGEWATPALAPRDASMEWLGGRQCSEKHVSCDPNWASVSGWGVSKGNVMAAFTKLHSLNGHGFQGLNEALLMFVPNRPDDSTPKDYRPIGLTHLFAKLVVKILAASLSLRLASWVKENQSIEDVLQFLKDSLPDVPMAIAHGKKVSKNIQLAMEKFSCGEIKILVCTHIIESGIDIPNANTMIVQYAELFGLAQLYQLRGRVGRSGREGFTYLFYTDKSLLSRIAMKQHSV